jgi:hypothetical protein
MGQRSQWMTERPLSSRITDPDSTERPGFLRTHRKLRGYSE